MDRRLRDLGHHDAYRLLGVPNDASREDIRAAFKRRMKDVHPDRAPGGSDEELSRLLIVARDVLLNHRSDYDAARATRKSPVPSRVPSAEANTVDPWETADAGVGATTRRHRPQPGFVPPEPPASPQRDWWNTAHGSTAPQPSRPPRPSDPRPRDSYAPRTRTRRMEVNKALAIVFLEFVLVLLALLVYVVVKAA
ncbi:J domain-containing protein [Streptomyces beihaiensis]|uniref:J domain-containing protein n=1 Tax=Streptomyces beihaiensis TaxID=2984495 RepID=A0ABT3U446_9ACTN|nr:J domain-containing protein [Streptomyces beihaiensis]MCX3063421.1 J domain-containing protein [Streptomyces beihaiensis]